MLQDVVALRPSQLLHTPMVTNEFVTLAVSRIPIEQEAEARIILQNVVSNKSCKIRTCVEKVGN